MALSSDASRGGGRDFREQDPGRDRAEPAGSRMSCGTAESEGVCLNMADKEAKGACAAFSLVRDSGG